ncbi:unnamed protein product [Lactuca virosa]|uniref:Protein kinase domain-containing protein n=1 Tax=Lactuca virosa TaxID=75947 RepID=A0AAU9MBC1_9ASTR|nr:unnamed protein product [Lactuca virosa]
MLEHNVTPYHGYSGASWEIHIKVTTSKSRTVAPFVVTLNTNELHCFVKITFNIIILVSYGVAVDLVSPLSSLISPTVYFLYQTGPKGSALKLILGISCLILMLLMILCQKKRLWGTVGALRMGTTRNHQIEMFIRNYGTMTPKRFKYSEIKKMTNSFSEKLGQGGYGSVYKGQLPDGQLVAVKLLGKAIGAGEDFINEVASIGRTSHANIVTLLGFCFEGNKRALMYEFMPNGSLDKFLRGDGSRLDWDTLFQIAKEIARGLEYLHQHCARKKYNFNNQSMSEAYFPDCIYDKVEGGDNLGVDGVTTEEEDELARKLVMVSLWCIQSDPSDRPSISKVMEMLEGSFQSIQVPPKSFWSSPPRPSQATSPSVNLHSSTGERVLAMHAAGVDLFS